MDSVNNIYENTRPAPTELKKHFIIILTLSDVSGALMNSLVKFKEYDISITRIESRVSYQFEAQFDFYIEFETSLSEIKKQSFFSELRKITTSFSILKEVSAKPAQDVPWFPRTLKDLDKYADRVLDYGEDLSVDHPGFNDPIYRARRAKITEIAKTYRTGHPISTVDYTPEETGTWLEVFTRLSALFPTHACKEHNMVFQALVDSGLYRSDTIPQLQDVSEFLKSRTGFTLRPVMGLLSSRDFLNGLAFRVFHSTQYIRHASKPFYTPEPDICHELLGHAPLFANPSFAAFSQEIGLCSLGASDDDIKKLATIYWFTVEFGLCRQSDTELRAYGAGLLSSFGELEYCLTSSSGSDLGNNAPARKIFDPSVTAVTAYPVTRFQPLYFVANSFLDAQKKVREFSKSLDRPFTVRYNPYTQSIQVLNTKETIEQYATDIENDYQTLVEGIKTL